MLDLYRYSSFVALETIELVQLSQLETHYDDAYLRKRSFLYSENGVNNRTSHAEIELKRQARVIQIYIKNNNRIHGNSWRIFVKKDIQNSKKISMT